MARLHTGDGLWTTLRAVTFWTLAFAGLHSLLASRPVKDWVRQRSGPAIWNGWYRIGFNVVAIVSFSLLLLRFSGLPDRELYRVRWPWSLPFRLMQLVSIGIILDANVRIGLGRMSGVQGMWQWLHGRTPIEQNPAQGPQLEGNLALRTGGSFQLCRHPNNLAPLLLWAANPRMTVRFLVFILVSAVYLLLGSVHEERRLRAAYGQRYDSYRAGKPFYFPWP